MKKLAVVCSGWHFPYDFYEKISKQFLPNDWIMEMYCVSHRNPIYSEEEKTNHHFDGDRAHLDKILYSKIAKIEDIINLGWIYKEYPNTIGDWGCSNQWLDDYNYKNYDLLLFTHDDNLILKNTWFKEVIEDYNFNKWEIWTNSIGAPIGMLRGSCEFFKPSILDKIGGKFDLSMVKLNRIGKNYGSRDINEVFDWNNTVYPLMKFILNNKIRVISGSEYYRVSQYCVEGERGFISGSQITNVDSENKGLRKYNLL
jgi:hypothetical protein